MRDRLPPHLVVAALLIALGSSRCAVSAQSDEVLVARVCWSESGPSTDECVAIANVLAHRASMRGVSLRSMTQAYAPRATGRRPYIGREWIARLDPDRRVAIPRRGDEWVRVRFAALVNVAWLALRGMIATACVGALHWAAPSCARCAETMRAAGYVRVPCLMANHFWMRGAL